MPTNSIFSILITSFNAFKTYAAQHDLHWGFVRDKDNRLYINNTEFVSDMADDHWKPLAEEF